MKEKSLLFQWVVPLMLLIALVGLIIYEQSKDKVLGGVGNNFRIPSVITTKTIAPTLTGGILNPIASSTLVLVANDNRRYARCTNITNATGSGSNNAIPVSFVLGADTTLGYGATTTGNYGIVLSPTASTSIPFSPYFEIDERNPFSGPVYASALATTTLTCIEN